MLTYSKLEVFSAAGSAEDDAWTSARPTDATNPRWCHQGAAGSGGHVQAKPASAIRMLCRGWSV